jgi:hypothetical protein
VEFERRPVYSGRSSTESGLVKIPQTININGNSSCQKVFLGRRSQPMKFPSARVMEGVYVGCYNSLVTEGLSLLLGSHPTRCQTRNIFSKRSKRLVY